MQKNELKKELPKLLPCPFCGGEAEIIQDRECWGHGEFVEMAYIQCSDCGVKGKSFYNREYPTEKCRIKSIESWNTRKPIDRIVEQLEEQMNDAKNLWDDDEYYTGQANAYEYAIDIVKAGGIDG